MGPCHQNVSRASGGACPPKAGATQCSRKYPVSRSPSATPPPAPPRNPGNGSNLYSLVDPPDWKFPLGSTISFDYRIPPGTPVGVWINVDSVGWLVIGGTATRDTRIGDRSIRGLVAGLSDLPVHAHP